MSLVSSLVCLFGEVAASDLGLGAIEPGPGPVLVPVLELELELELAPELGLDLVPELVQ